MTEAKRITIYMTDDIYIPVEKQAQEENRSFSNMVVTLLKRALEEKTPCSNDEVHSVKEN